MDSMSNSRLIIEIPNPNKQITNNIQIQNFNIQTQTLYQIKNIIKIYSNAKFDV